MLSRGSLLALTLALVAFGYLIYHPVARRLGVAVVRDEIEATSDDDPEEEDSAVSPADDEQAGGVVEAEKEAVVPPVTDPVDPSVDPPVDSDGEDSDGEDVADSDSRPEPEIDDAFVLPDDLTGGGAPVAELIGLSPEDYPEEVLLKRSVKLTNSNGEERFILPGKLVKPVGFQGSMILVEMISNGAFKAEIKVTETDLLDRLEFRQKVSGRINELGLQYAGLDKKLSQSDMTDTGEEIEFIGEEAMESLVRGELAKGVLPDYTVDKVTMTKYEGRGFVVGQGVFEVLDVELLHDTIFGQEKINLWALVKGGELQGWAFGGENVIVPVAVPGTMKPKAAETE